LKPHYSKQQQPQGDSTNKNQSKQRKKIHKEAKQRKKEERIEQRHPNNIFSLSRIFLFRFLFNA